MWQGEFDRHVQEGESAIWIWTPIITKQCPECGNSPSYHEDSLQTQTDVVYLSDPLPIP